jgi:hypothetical protein
MSLLPDLGSAIGGPLVAAPVNVSSPFDGLWLVQDGIALADGISSGNWVEGGLAAFSLLLDGVAALIDPIGTLIGMGLSWVLEHIWPLNEYLNALTGNAGEVLRMSQTWANISGHLGGAGANLSTILNDLQGLEGAAMDAYRKFQADVAEHIQLAGTLASATSAGLEIASTIVKIVHDLTRDVISQIAGTAISAAITTAATVGFGAPVAIAQVAARVSALVPKVTRAIEALVRSLDALGPLLKKVDDINDALKRVLDRVLPGTPPAARPPAQPDGQYYSVAYQMTLDPSVWASSRSVHFNRANVDIDAAMQSDPNFAAAMESMSPGIGPRVAIDGGRQNPNPADFIWHHAHPDTVDGQHGVMQLVPTPQHTPGSDFWGTLHPGNKGGFSVWGKK